jgi:hypothetical protein
MTPETRKTEQALHRQEADKRMYDAYLQAEQRFFRDYPAIPYSDHEHADHSWRNGFAQGFWTGWLMNLGVPIEEIGEEKL